MTARVVLLGIDGAVGSLLMNWAEKGLLPTFQRMLNSGFTSTVEGPVGFGDAPTWATVHTGVSPAHHGRYSYRQFRKGTYQKSLTVDADLKAEPFWLHLSRAGKRVAILDMPKSPLPDDLNGLFLGDWQVHGREHSQPVSCPAEFAEQVLQRYGPAPPSKCGLNQPALDIGGYRTMMEHLLRSIRMKRDLILSVLDGDDWDFVAASFKECHCIGHHAWHLRDPDHPAFDQDAFVATGDPLLRIYQAIDEALAEIMTRAGPDATSIALSPLGMCPHYGAFAMLPDLLGELGYSGNLLVRSARGALKALAGSPRHPPSGGRGSPQRTNLRSRVSEEFEARKNCLSVDLSEHVSGLRINLAGREPKGRIRPGKERDAFETQLVTDFLALKDRDTGEPLVDRILRTRDHYSGPMLEDLPDLLVYWNMSRPVSAAISPKLGTVRATRSRRRTGAHRDGGVLLAMGPDIACGSSPEAIDATRIAPTVSALLGLEFPQGIAPPIQAITKDGRSEPLMA